MGPTHVYLGEIRMICMMCTRFVGCDLCDLDLMHNFSIAAKKDLDDLDHDLSEVRKLYMEQLRTSVQIESEIGATCLSIVLYSSSNKTGDNGSQKFEIPEDPSRSLPERSPLDPI